MLDWLAYAVALVLGVAIGWGLWRLLTSRRHRPRPISIDWGDPTLTCTLVPPDTARTIIGDRVLWFAEGPTKRQSVLIYPRGNLGVLIDIDHPDSEVKEEVLRLLGTVRADYVLLHPVRYAPVGVALRPSPNDTQRQQVHEQLGQIAGQAGLQVLWLTNHANGDIDDVVRAVSKGALAPLSE